MLVNTDEKSVSYQEPWCSLSCEFIYFRSIDNKRMSDFFKNDFNQDRWRKAALKNAFDLLGKQRFEHAAAFFLLGASLNDAVEVSAQKHT